MPSQFFFIRGQYQCAQPAQKVWVFNSYQLPFGKAFFCPICAEVWAQALVEDQETFVEHILCDKHQPTASRPTPGCITVSWDEEWNKSLPKEILARDFLLMLNHKESVN